MMGLHRHEKGSILVEIVVFVAITAVISASISTFLFQVMKTSERSQNHLEATHDLEEIEYWLRRDIPRAISSDLVDGDEPAGSMTVSWSESGVQEEVTYSLSGSSVTRLHEDSTRALAEDISHLSFQLTDGAIRVRVTTQPGGRWGVSESFEYWLWLRANQ